jgi:hypothetical protein
MAERGRFELPIRVKVWLISSQFVARFAGLRIASHSGECSFYINLTGEQDDLQCVAANGTKVSWQQPPLQPPTCMVYEADFRGAQPWCLGV